MQFWKVRESKYLVRSKWLTLRADSCETAEGASIDPYYVLEYPDWVHIVAFDTDNRILVTQQYRHAVGAICMEIPCGEIEPEETPLAAARRELMEETGYAAKEIEKLCCFYPNPARQNNRVHCFVATGCFLGGEALKDPLEAIESRFVHITTLMDIIDSGAFSQALHVSSVLMALRKRQLLS